MRLFIGIPAPPSEAYAEVKRGLAKVPGARAVPDGNEHVTLRFLGDHVEVQAVADALGAACRGRAAMPCVVEGLGTFGGGFPPDKRARVAWAGVRASGIEALADAVVAATAHLGEPPERRPFVAHITLARFTRPADLRSLVSAHRGTLFAQGTLDRVVLYASIATPHGPRYEPMATAHLA